LNILIIPSLTSHIRRGTMTFCNWKPPLWYNG